MARFRHPLKLKMIDHQKMRELLEEHNSQKAVAAILGVSQMTVCRRAKALGINHNGKTGANKSEGKRKAHSEKLKSLYLSGKIKPYWSGKEQPREIVAARVSKLKGRIAWNKGVPASIATKEALKKANSGRSHSEETKKKMSISAKSNITDEIILIRKENARKQWQEGKFDHLRQGRGKGGRHKGIWMRSSWEVEFAKNLDKNEISWKYEPRRFKLSDGSSYCPDFFIESKNLWIEIKGHWFEKAKNKFELFKKEYPEINVIVIQEKPLWHTLLNG